MNDIMSWISAHADLMNVTGSEDSFAAYLRNELASEGIQSSTDDLGCIFVSGKNKDTFVTAMMDVSGYLLLQKNMNGSILIPTLNIQEDRGESISVIDACGKTVQASRGKDPDSLYTISSLEYDFGSPFKEQENIKSVDGKLIGRNATRYALLYLLFRLAKTVNTGCLFASFGRSNAPVEYNFSVREKMKAAVFLGAIEAETNDPVVLVRDGKCFSNPELLEKAESAGFYPMVTDEIITKAHLCANAGVRVLTLALPYRTNEDGEREVQTNSIDKFYSALINLF